MLLSSVGYIHLKFYYFCVLFIGLEVEVFHHFAHRLQLAAKCLGRLPDFLH